jgi:hypothetical protein
MEEVDNSPDYVPPEPISPQPVHRFASRKSKRDAMVKIAEELQKEKNAAVEGRSNPGPPPSKKKRKSKSAC